MMIGIEDLKIDKKESFSENHRNMQLKHHFLAKCRIYKAGKNAQLPWNMLTNCVKNVIFLQILVGKKQKYLSK